MSLGLPPDGSAFACVSRKRRQVIRGASSKAELWPHLVQAVVDAPDVDTVHSLVSEIRAAMGVSKVVPVWVEEQMQRLSAQTTPRPVASTAPPHSVTPRALPGPLPEQGYVGLRLHGQKGVSLDALRQALLHHLGSDLGVDELTVRVVSWMRGCMDAQHWHAAAGGHFEMFIPVEGVTVRISSRRIDGTPVTLEAPGAAAHPIKRQRLEPSPVFSGRPQAPLPAPLSASTPAPRLLAPSPQPTAVPRGDGPYLTFPHRLLPVLGETSLQPRPHNPRPHSRSPRRGPRDSRGWSPARRSRSPRGRRSCTPPSRRDRRRPASPARRPVTELRSRNSTAVAAPSRRSPPPAPRREGRPAVAWGQARDVPGGQQGPF